MIKAIALILAALFASVPLFAQGGGFGNHFCLDGTCDIATPVYVNVYWSSDVATWNSETNSQNPGATVARIDALTLALAHSYYFLPLEQYTVDSVTVGPSIMGANLCGQPPATIDAAENQVGSFARCILHAHPELDPSVTILNVLLPPHVGPAPGSPWCSTKAGNHDKFGSPVEITVVPTVSACNSGVQNIFSSMSHEMVEGATDPVPDSPTGWKVLFGSEVADICDNPTPPTTGFLFGLVQLFFDQNSNVCDSGLSSPWIQAPPPPAPSMQICGTGQSMQITLNGIFGNTPWDLANTAPAWDLNTNTMAGGGSTLYIQAAVSGSHTWRAGSPAFDYPVDPTGLGPIAWTFPSDSIYGINGDSVIVSGFDSNYGVDLPSGGQARVSAGDVVTMNIWTQDGAQLTVLNATAPGPKAVNGFAASRWPFSMASPPWTFVGDTVQAGGQLVDGSNCPIEGFDLQMTASGPPSTPSVSVSDTSLGNGNFTIFFTPVGVAGNLNLQIVSPFTASTSIAIHPVIASKDHTIGDVAGGQTVTLTGAGFAAGATAIHFRYPSGDVSATGVSVANSSTVSFVTPPAMGGTPGLVEAVAIVNGVESLAFSYEYVVPDQPILKFISGCPPNRLEVNAYNADGSTASEQIVLSAGYAAFRSPMGTMVSELTVSPGSITVMAGVGPVTATPSADPSLAVTQTFVQATVVPWACTPHPEPFYPAFDFPPPNLGDPYESVVLPESVLPGGGVLWMPGNPSASTAGTYLLMVGADRAAGEALEVRKLGVKDLHTAVHEHSFAFAIELAGSTSVRFSGPSLELAMAGKGLRKTPADFPEATIAFAAPPGADPQNCVLLWLGPSAASWIEVDSVVTRTGGSASIHAKVSQIGTYALAQLQ
jgi:hypothetical protein